MLDFTRHFIRTYRGFANGNRAVILGHVLKGTKNEKQIEVYRSPLKHAYNVLKMFFMHSPDRPVTFEVEFRGDRHEVKTDNNGFFFHEMTIPDLEPGWHRYNVLANKKTIHQGLFVMPCETKYGIISDIDDTYLVSHSTSTIKKLGTMLFRNVTKRKRFKDVLDHYHTLSNYETKPNEENVFFNVSSSEWNLYPLLEEFLQYNDFPNAVLFLDKLKNGLGELLFSGKGDHNHKLKKIQTIIDFYPERQFILIGDDTQRDPYIYHEIVHKQPNRFAFVQIRQVGEQKKPEVQDILNQIPIPVDYFHSSQQTLAWIEETN